MNRLCVILSVFLIFMPLQTAFAWTPPSRPIMRYFSTIGETMWHAELIAEGRGAEEIAVARFRQDINAGLSSFDAEAAIDIIRASPSIVYLDLSGRPFTDRHTAAIAGHTYLRYLNVADTKLTIDAAVTLLQTLPALQVLVYSSKDPGASAKFDAFRPQIDIRVVQPREPVGRHPDGMFISPPVQCSVPESIRTALVECRALSKKDFDVRGLQRVWFTDRYHLSDATLPGFDELATTPAVQVIEAFGSPIGPKHLERLAGINTVVYLGIARTWVSAANLPLLNRLKGLLYLHLDSGQVTAESIAEIAKHPTLKYLIIDTPGDLSTAQVEALQRLSSLKVHYRVLLPDNIRPYSPRAHVWCPRFGISDLCGCQEFPKLNIVTGLAAFMELESVNLDEPVTPHIAAALYRLSMLRSLQLQDIDVRTEDFERLRTLTQLTALYFSSCNFAASDLRLLSPLQDLQDLRVMRDNSTGNVELDKTSIESLLPMARLRSLGIGGMHISSDTVLAISKMPQIKDLILSKTALSVDSARALHQLKQLESLYLNNIAVEMGALDMISRLEHLRILRLNGTAAREVDILALAQLPNLAELSLLNMNSTPGIKAKIEMLNPMLKVEVLPVQK